MIVQEYIFNQANMTAGGGGSFDVYSTRSINGEIQSITLGSNSYTTTGSIQIMESGLLGINIITLRAGSYGVSIYPVFYGALNQAQYISGTTGAYVFQPVVNGPIRVVGSALGSITSGLGLMIRYS